MQRTSGGSISLFTLHSIIIDDRADETGRIVCESRPNEPGTKGGIAIHVRLAVLINLVESRFRKRKVSG